MFRCRGCLLSDVYVAYVVRIYERMCASPGRLVAFEVYGDGYDAVVVAADEVEYFFAYGAGLDVVFDATEGVEYRCLGLIDVTVSLGRVVDVFGREVSSGGHNFGVDTVVYGGVMRQDDIWRHVSADSASAFDKYPFADI